MGTAKSLMLCSNCLNNGATGYPIGPEFGSQRDPERHTVSLCAECIKTLEAGRLDLFNDRFVTDRPAESLRGLLEMQRVR